MRCRKCNEYIDMETVTCPFCGFIVTDAERKELRLISEMKQDMERLDDTCKAFSDDIGRMSDRLRQFRQSAEQRIYGREETTKKDSAPLASDKGRGAAQSNEWTFQEPDDVETEETRLPVVETVKETSVKAVRKQKATSYESFELRLGQKWLLVIGIVTMILGVGYFLKYSIQQGWIGPAGRVAMAYAWGLVLMGGGEYFRREQYERFGYSLTASGAATLYFGTFAAHHLYGLFSLPLSFTLMAGVTLALCMLSLMFSSFWLAVLGMLGGFGTPFMLGLGHGHMFILGYLTVLNLGFLFIAYRKRWPVLEALGLAFTYILFGAWLDDHFRTFAFVPVLGFTALFALLYHAVPFATAYLGRERKSGSLYAPFVLLINTVLSLALCTVVFYRYVYNMAWMGLPIVLHAASLAAMAMYLKFKRPEETGALTALFIGSSVLSCVAVPVVFDGYRMTLGWAFLAVAFQLAGRGLRRRELLGGAYLLLTVAAMKFVLYDYTHTFILDPGSMTFFPSYSAHLFTRLAVTAGVLVPLFVVALTASHWKEQFFLEGGREYTALYGAFGIALFIMANVETAACFAEYIPVARFAALSVLWTVFSVGFMLVGFRKNSHAARRAALVLFFITLVKVFFLDMAHVGTPWRILSFIVLGTVLIGTSYLYYRFRDRIIEAMGEKREQIA